MWIDVPHQRPPRSWTNDECKWLTGILLLAAALRIWAAIASTAIVKDGERYLTHARQFVDHPVEAIAKGGELPLYPAGCGLIYQMMRPFTDAGDPFVLAAAGRACSIVAGIWIVLMVHLLARSLFDRRVGLLTAAFAAMMDQFVLYSADVVADPLYIAMYLTAAWAVLWAWHRPGAWRFFLAGVSASLAYMTRREGIEVLGGLGLLLLVARGYGWRRRAAHGASAVAGFLLLAGPCMAMIGGFSPAHDDNLGPFWSWLRSLSACRQDNLLLAVTAPERLERAGTFFVVFLEKWSRSHRYILAATFVLGFVLPGRLRAAKAPATLLAILAAQHFLLLAAFRQLHPVTSIRYVMPIVVLLLPWSAAGLSQLCHFLATRAGRRRPLSRKQLQTRVNRTLAGAMIVIAAIFLPYVYRGNQGDASWIPKAAVWLRANGDPRARLLVTDPRVGFYAERECIWLEQPGPYDPPYPTPDELLRMAREQGCRHLVGDFKTLGRVREGRLLAALEGHASIERLVPTDEELARVCRAGGDLFMVYRLDW